MEYRKKETILVLKKGKYKGFDYFILSLGIYPTAYVRIPKQHKYYKKDYEDIPISVHGGLTFSGRDFTFNPITLKESWWIGWDYIHAGDFRGYSIDKKIGQKNKKWTTEEIFEDVKDVIIQIIDDRKDGE